MRLPWLILTVVILYSVPSFAQTGNLSGIVRDQRGAALQMASVKITETSQQTITDGRGQFNFRVNIIGNEELTLEFSYIGTQKVVRKIKLDKSGADAGVIILKDLDLSLDEIVVRPNRVTEAQSNSSLLITRDVIEQTPALSLNDILNLIPNRKITPPSLQNVQQINLRTTHTSGGSHGLNNSFGVAIIMDGNAISNNSNMQSRNPGILGVNNSRITSGSSWGLSGSGNTSYSGDYAFGGTDLRQIPVENIESVEVISGVAPAKYGDLSDGAIIVERQAGKSPAYLRMQLRGEATSYSASKGFANRRNTGAINLSVNYTSSFNDNRDKLKAYRRLNSGIMWTQNYGADKRFKNTLSVDYGRNLDGIKRDPDDPYGSMATFNNWNFSASNRSSYRFSGSFLKNIGVNLRYSQGFQESYSEAFANESYRVYTDAITTGIHEGFFAPGIYTAISHVEGKPVDLSAKIDGNFEVLTGEIVHHLGAGFNYNYSANRGRGQIVDPSQPRASIAVNPRTSSAQTSERYYDYRLVIPQIDMGAFLEDQFRFRIADRMMTVRAGVRMDNQNNYITFSPRTNLSYQVSKNFKLGLAYGIGNKSPGLAQRFPGPVFFDVPLAIVSNGNANESIYLVYVDRYVPSNENLKPSRSESLELTAAWTLRDFSVSLAGFYKRSRNGITTASDRSIVNLPVYTRTDWPAGQKPVMTVTDNRNYLLNYSRFTNALSSDNIGLEMVVSTPRVPVISTSFGLSAGIFNTSYTSAIDRFITPSTPPSTAADYARSGVYFADNYTSWTSSARISSSTHIPKISLMINLIAEFDLLNKDKRTQTNGVPYAYYTNDLRYYEIKNFDASNQFYNYLLITNSEANANNSPRIYSNYHMSLSKEIRKIFRISFNVYNFLNYQPTYVNSAGSIVRPNSAPSFGAEISVKI